MSLAAVSTSCDPRIGGLPGLAVRLGSALESWGRRAAVPIASHDIERRLDAQLRLTQAIAARESATQRHLMNLMR